ncbi:MAG: CAP domain-containing protein [bacterium]|nr:CAP domain-containing protein [bacterium]
MVRLRLVLALGGLILLVLSTGAFWESRDRLRHRVSQQLDRLPIPVRPRVATPGPLRAPERPPVPGEVLTQAGVVRETNERRSRADLSALKEQATLHAAAERKISDMFARQYFAHDNPDGQGISTVVSGLGYAYLRVGENLALGNFENDAALVDAWMASPGHRANILHAGYSEIGVAVRRGQFQKQDTWLAVQVFALPKSACPVVDEMLRKAIDTQERELEALDVRIREQRTRVDELTRERGALAAEVTRLVNEGNVKIAEGNAEIEEGNRIYRETGDRSAAEPHWTRGEQLRREGNEKHEEARAKEEELRRLQDALTGLIREVNGIVDTFNRLQKEQQALVAKVNVQIEAFNTCIK